ncbi:MAG: GNAT family N-acetyltransferase [Acidimicrobiia bacterium]
MGVIAEVDGSLVGAAWLRFLTHPDPGHGYVADDVPELSLGVLEVWRGRGIGRALLRELIAAASEAGIRKLSLSVERANFARNLYLQEGFEFVARGIDADTMVLNL